MHNDCRRQTNKGTGEEAIKSHEHNDTGRTVHGDKTHAQHGRDETAGNHNVERSQYVGEDVGHDAAKDRGAIHDGEEVKRQIFIGDVSLKGVELGVKEGHVQAHEAGEEAGDLNGVGGYQEGGEIEERAGFRGQDADAHDEVGDEHGGEDDETEDARCPCEAEPREEFVEHDGVNDAAKGGARCGDANGHADACGEVGGEDGDAGDEQRAGSDADAEGLGEEDLPVRMGEGEHHLAEDEHEAAKEEEGAEVAGVIDGACEGGDEQEEEGLDAADPGDGGGAPRGEQLGFIVGLVGAKGIYNAPRIEE